MNFSSYVSIGNSLTASYQNGSLYESSQMYSYGALIAQQVGGVTFEQPIISDPGTVGRMEISAVNFATGNIQIVRNTNQGSPTNSGYSKSYNNLGVPGALLADVLMARDAASSLGKSPFFDIVLRGKGTQLEQAISLNPTFVTLWIGNNDILGYATSGGILPHTPTATFDALYQQLAGALAQTGAKVAVGNIPDVKSIPFFTTVGPAIAQAISGNAQVLGLVYQHSTTGIGLAPAADLASYKVLVTLSGLPYASLIGDTQGTFYTMTGRTVPTNVNTAYPFGVTPENPWPNDLILDPAEMAEVVATVKAFNLTISQQAAKYGFAYVQMDYFFNDIAKNGILVDGVRYTTSYLTGGIFSLDGVHPTTRGYGIVANIFINIINRDFGSKIPFVNVSQLPGSIPLVEETSVLDMKIDPKIFENMVF